MVLSFLYFTLNFFLKFNVKPINNMKIEWRKYLFEIIVIFIGITISFIFESWRQKQEEISRQLSLLVVIQNDLNRSYSWIEEIDSNYIETIQMIADFRKDKAFKEADFVNLIWRISEDPIDFPLRELSPFIKSVSNTQDYNVLHKTNKIVTLVSYIQNLTASDLYLSASITECVTEKVWPKLNTDSLFDKIIKGDPNERWGSDTTIVWSDRTYTIDTFEGLNKDMAFIELKMIRLVQVHAALKMQIGNLQEELTLL